METSDLYRDIARRTEGDIYIGVVGPVRTGKSTLIKRFMEELVIPSIDNVYRRERARDELPQSGAGRTIMTAEPKFIPEEAVEISVGPAAMKVRMVDCVGYMVKGALGHLEDGEPRMVSTPWFDHPVTMAEAAETGTKKVIREHSTIGLVVTTDGSIGDIPREDYVDAEERVISELKEIGKPFILLLNSSRPESEEAILLSDALRVKYGVTCVVEDCLNLSRTAIDELIKSVLYEFPVAEVRMFAPTWATAAGDDHWLMQSLSHAITDAAKSLRRVADIDRMVAEIVKCEYVDAGRVERISLGEGVASVRLDLPRSLFYKILSEQSGFEIGDDGDLPTLLANLADAKRKYDRVAEALQRVDELGYGVVMPELGEMKLEEPEMIHQGGRFGVRLKASAPSIHMLRANIEAEVNPLVGSEKQSEELVQYLMQEFQEDTAKLWQSNIFGKSLHELVSEGLNNKLTHMPDDAQEKLRETLERIINEGSGGLICILL